MELRYLYSLDPNDANAETIMVSDSISELRNCIEEFWENLGYEIPYYRFNDFGNEGIVIDFSHHHRFYHVVGYEGTMQEFSDEWVRK